MGRYISELSDTVRIGDTSFSNQGTRRTAYIMGKQQIRGNYRKTRDKNERQNERQNKEQNKEQNKKRNKKRNKERNKGNRRRGTGQVRDRH